MMIPSRRKNLKATPNTALPFLNSTLLGKYVVPIAPKNITTITMAAYTFTTLTVAIINVIKYRKYDSPIYSASKAISLAAASVSIITLESTMLTTFGGETMDAFTQKLMLGLTGGAIAAFIIGMAIYMIVQSTKRLNLMNNKDGLNGKQ